MAYRTIEFGEGLSRYLPSGSELGYGNYMVSYTKVINMLLVGRCQTGKTTLVQTLINPHRGTSSTGFSDTRDPACNKLILFDKETRRTYQLNIIDTPGLKEVRETENSRSDDELLNLAVKCVEENITTLNVICFVSKAGDTHRLDIEVFKKVKSCLGEKFGEISIMVLTHCDEFPDNTLDDFERKIKSHVTSKPFADYCKLGIERFGAIDSKKLESFEEEIRGTIVLSRLKRTEKMRNKFLEKIISCADRGLKVGELQRLYDDAENAKAQAIKQAIDAERKRSMKETLSGSSGPCSIL